MIINLISKAISKIRYNIILDSFKTISNFKNYISICILTRIRNIANYKTRGNNTKNDNIVNNIFKKITEINKNGIIEDESLVIYEKCKTDNTLSKLLEVYKKSQNLFDKKHNKLGESKSIVTSELILNKEEKKELGKLKNEAKKILKKDLDDIVDRTRIKLDLSMSKITSYLPIATSVIFIGSYLNTRILFDFYGVDINLFFQLTDYINIGVKNIESAIFICLILIIYFASITSNMFIVPITNNEKSKFSFKSLFFIIPLILYVYYSLKENILNVVRFLDIIGLILIFILFSKVIFKYIKKPLETFPILFFTALFIVLMASNATKTYFLPKERNIKAIFKKNYDTECDTLEIIMINNNYTFFRTKSNEMKIEKNENIKTYKKL
jgi:hypothetical protein